MQEKLAGHEQILLEKITPELIVHERLVDRVDHLHVPSDKALVRLFSEEARLLMVLPPLLKNDTLNDSPDPSARLFSDEAIKRGHNLLENDVFSLDAPLKLEEKGEVTQDLV